jgi:hypothetical protein
MRRAMTAPTVPPTATPSTISIQFCVTDSVVSTAIAMPMMPNRLPLRALSGEDSPLRDRTKNTDATRYASATWFADIQFSETGSFPAVSRGSDGTRRWRISLRRRPT